MTWNNEAIFDVVLSVGPVHNLHNTHAHKHTWNIQVFTSSSKRMKQTE